MKIQERIQIAFALAVSLTLIAVLMAVVYVALPVVAIIVFSTFAIRSCYVRWFWNT